MKIHCMFAAPLAFALALGPQPVFAAKSLLSDPHIRGAKLCTQEFSRQEQQHGIPSQLLAAISNTESGRWNDKLGMMLPWPWTINAEGKGYYFDSKAEAIRKVRQLQRQGMKSIDIGCMQVNLKHHPDAFASIHQAFDPKHNVAYAASFLRGHYDDMRNWNKAIAAYHSKTPKYGNKYLANVQKAWEAISGKVRVARAALRETPRLDRPSYRIIDVKDADATRQVARLGLEKPRVRALPLEPGKKRFSLKVREEEERGSDAPRTFKLRAVDRLPKGMRVKPPRMKRISVSDGASPRKETMIIRANSNAETAQLAAKPTMDSPAQRALFVSHHDKGTKKSPAKKVTPKFVFVE